MSTENKRIVRDFLEGAWNYEKLVSLENALAPDYVMHGPTGTIEGRRAYRDAVSNELESLADVFVKVDEAIVEGDRVVTRYTTTFDQHGECMGAFPTGHTITMRGISIHRVADGKVAESWETYDRRSLLRDRGAEQGLQEHDREAIENVVKEALKIGLRNIPAHVNLYYAEGAEVVAAHGVSMRGKDAIRAWLERFPSISDWKLTDVRIDGAGEVAYVRGSYTMLLSSRAKLPFDKGQYLEVWRKQTDCSWKVIRHIYVSEIASRTRTRAAQTPALARA
jgi:predicted ester cyclase/ketosteroid isomerase-like protein